MTAHKGNDCIATNKGRKLNHFAMHCMGNHVSRYDIGYDIGNTG